VLQAAASPGAEPCSLPDGRLRSFLSQLPFLSFFLSLLQAAVWCALDDI
jgi:hypothetical protein